MAEAAAPHPSASLGTRGKTRQQTVTTVGFQSPGMTTGFTAGGPRHPRLALCPHPLLRDDGSRLAARPLPSPASADSTRSESCLGPTPTLGKRAPVPRGPGSELPGVFTRATTDRRQPSARSRPRRPGRETSTILHPRGYRGARLYSHTAHLPVHTIPHINNPSPPDPHPHHPRKLLFPRPQTRCHPPGVKGMGGSQQGL